MKNASKPAQYPRLNEQAAYREPAEKLAQFCNRREVEHQKLADLEDELSKQSNPERARENPEEKAIQQAEAMIAGTLSPIPLTEQIETQRRLVSSLEAAIKAQTTAVSRVEGELRVEAGKKHIEEHKALVRRIIAAVHALHEANKQEQDFRARLEELGYFGALPAMFMLGLGDPSDRDGSRAYYWIREAEAYLLTPEERAAITEKEAAYQDAAKTKAADEVTNARRRAYGW